MNAAVFHRYRILLQSAVGILFLISSNIDVKANETSLDQGRRVSEKHCSRCHVIAKHNPMGGISSTPSFAILVNALSDWQDRFRSFYARPPHPSIIRMEGEKLPVNYLPTSYPIHLKFKEIDAIIDFVETLKK